MAFQRPRTKPTSARQYSAGDRQVCQHRQEGEKNQETSDHIVHGCAGSVKGASLQNGGLLTTGYPYLRRVANAGHCVVCVAATDRSRKKADHGRHRQCGACFVGELYRRLSTGQRRSALSSHPASPRPSRRSATRATPSPAASRPARPRPSGSKLADNTNPFFTKVIHAIQKVHERPLVTFITKLPNSTFGTHRRWAR